MNLEFFSSSNVTKLDWRLLTFTKDIQAMNEEKDSKGIVAFFLGTIEDNRKAKSVSEPLGVPLYFPIESLSDEAVNDQILVPADAKLFVVAQVIVHELQVSQAPLGDETFLPLVDNRIMYLKRFLWAKIADQKVTKTGVSQNTTLPTLEQLLGLRTPEPTGPNIYKKSADEIQYIRDGVHHQRIQERLKPPSGSAAQQLRFGEGKSDSDTDREQSEENNGGGDDTESEHDLPPEEAKSAPLPPEEAKSASLPPEEAVEEESHTVAYARNAISNMWKRVGKEDRITANRLQRAVPQQRSSSSTSINGGAPQQQQENAPWSMEDCKEILLELVGLFEFVRLLYPMYLLRCIPESDWLPENKEEEVPCAYANLLEQWLPNPVDYGRTPVRRKLCKAINKLEAMPPPEANNDAIVPRNRANALCRFLVLCTSDWIKNASTKQLPVKFDTMDKFHQPMNLPDALHYLMVGEVQESYAPTLTLILRFSVRWVLPAYTLALLLFSHPTTIKRLGQRARIHAIETSGAYLNVHNEDLDSNNPNEGITDRNSEKDGMATISVPIKNAPEAARFTVGPLTVAAGYNRFAAAITSVRDRLFRDIDKEEGVCNRVVIIDVLGEETTRFTEALQSLVGEAVQNNWKVTYPFRNTAFQFRSEMSELHCYEKEGKFALLLIIFQERITNISQARQIAPGRRKLWLRIIRARLSAKRIYAFTTPILSSDNNALASRHLTYIHSCTDEELDRLAFGWEKPDSEDDALELIKSHEIIGHLFDLWSKISKNGNAGDFLKTVYPCVVGMVVRKEESRLVLDLNPEKLAQSDPRAVQDWFNQVWNVGAIEQDAMKMLIKPITLYFNNNTSKKITKLVKVAVVKTWRLLQLRTTVGTMNLVDRFAKRYLTTMKELNGDGPQPMEGVVNARSEGELPPPPPSNGNARTQPNRNAWSTGQPAPMPQQPNRNAWSTGQPAPMPQQPNRNAWSEGVSSAPLLPQTNRNAQLDMKFEDVESDGDGKSGGGRVRKPKGESGGGSRTVKRRRYV